MPRKEKYLTKENLESEVEQLIAEINKSGGRDREFQLKGDPALLVTDMQEYFLSPDSHAFVPSTEAIIPNILKLIHHFTEKKYSVIYTQHFNDESNAGNMKTWWNDLITTDSPLHSLSPSLPSPNRAIEQSPNRAIEQSPNRAIEQSPNRSIAQSSSPPSHHSTLPLVIKKNQYDAFHQTELENILKKNNISTLIICGVMTNLCCETTLRSAFVRGFNAIMPVDATAAYKKEYHISTFVNLSFGFCPVKTTKEILELIT